MAGTRVRLRERSRQLFAEALDRFPGGVNSPVRAFRAVGGEPFFVERAKGARVWDVDGHEYVDYVGTWGPAILGHAEASIVRAVQEAAVLGTSFGIPNPRELELARLIQSRVAGIEKLRFCNSGTEACLSAIRLARGFTGREVIVKFDGCYHGHVDSLLVKAGSGALTFGHPDSAGVPGDLARLTAVVPFNDPGAIEALFRERGREIAGVIVEGVPANAGLYLPRPEFYPVLSRCCAEHGALLIVDEVMTGFRLGPGGAQERYGVAPDLTCFGKIIGGGLPVGALGGRAACMDQLAPLGPVYQAGTLSGNPIAMAAGVASLKALDATAYRHLETLGGRLAAGMRAAAHDAGVALEWQWVGSLFCGYFTDAPVRNLADALRCDRGRFATFFHGMLDEGFYFAPSPFEAGFLSTAHTEADIDATVAAARRVFRRLS